MPQNTHTYARALSQKVWVVGFYIKQYAKVTCLFFFKPENHMLFIFHSIFCVIHTSLGGGDKNHTHTFPENSPRRVTAAHGDTRHCYFLSLNAR